MPGQPMGQGVHVPPNLEHCFCNRSTVDVVILVISSPQRRAIAQTWDILKRIVFVLQLPSDCIGHPLPARVAGHRQRPVSVSIVGNGTDSRGAGLIGTSMCATARTPSWDMAIRGEMPDHRRRSRSRGPAAWFASVPLSRFRETINWRNVRGQMLYCPIVQVERDDDRRRMAA
jgi:hypothetical protein